jgi:hypothetical protein
MKSILSTLFTFLLFCGFDSALAGDDLICCGGEEVSIVDPANPEVVKWSWRAADSPTIPKDFRMKFRATDECKPYRGGRILITSSSGGVTLIDRDTRKCLFLAEARNAHSACLLPANSIAVASSTGGDEIIFFDREDARQPAVPVEQIPLKGAHGVVWDARRDCLWALGEVELLCLFADVDAESSKRWSVGARHALPNAGGHDLSLAEDGVNLLVTTTSKVLVFHRDESTFSPFEMITDSRKIKSIDAHSTTGKIVYHQASKTHWSSDMIRFVGSDPVKVEGARLYKIRWDDPDIAP